MFNFYDKHIKGFEFIVDIIYQTSLVIMVMLASNLVNYTDTYAYKVAATFFVAFGLWSFSIKNYSKRQALKDLFTKFLIIFVSAFVFAWTTLKVKFSGLEAFICTICIMVVYLISNRKSIWPDKLKSSSKEYLKRTVGDILSRVPEIIMFFCIIIPGLINAPKWGLLVGLGLGCLSDILFVSLALKKRSPPNSL